jgi:prepilin-type N-terminal cleavage/methylation domain-containing protein
MNASRRTSRGFTLVEILIAMVLMALLMVAAALAMEAAHDSHTYNAQKNDLVFRTRGVLDRIARDIRVAKSFQVPNPRALDVTLFDETVHTYAWDGTDGGNLIYTVTDDLVVREQVLTGQVHAFSASDDGLACSVSLALEGDLATSEATLTATPRKSVF